MTVAHTEAFAALYQPHEATLRKIDALGERMAASLRKAKTDHGHCDRHQTFAAELGAKLDELTAWLDGQGH